MKQGAESFVDIAKRAGAGIVSPETGHAAER